MAMIHRFWTQPVRWARFLLSINLFSVGWVQGRGHQDHKFDQTPSVRPASQPVISVTYGPGPMGAPPTKPNTKLEVLGWKFGEPMKWGVKLDFGGFLSEPKTVGGGMGGMLFLGPKNQLVVEVLIRAHYVFGASYKTMFETDLKLGYVVPLWSRTAVVFKVGFGYMGWFPPSAANDTPQMEVPPDHNYLTIPLEAAILFDLSPSVDLEISPSVMPMFELGGSPNFRGGIFMGLIFHPPKLIATQSSSLKQHHHEAHDDKRHPM